MQHLYHRRSRVPALNLQIQTALKPLGQTLDLPLDLKSRAALVQYQDRDLDPGQDLGQDLAHQLLGLDQYLQIVEVEVQANRIQTDNNSLIRVFLVIYMNVV